MDAMDHEKNELPHFARANMTSGSADTFKQVVMGAIVHGFGRFLFVANESVSHGPDLMLECLHRTLQ